MNAFIRAGINDDVSLQAIEDITLKTGELFQIQDDFLDCYGDPAITGKVGTDIRDGKLSWLIAKAIQVASPPQMKALHAHYGQPSATAEYEVKCIYDEIGVQDVFYKYEDAERADILRKIRDLPKSVPQEPFLDVMDALYRRDK